MYGYDNPTDLVCVKRHTGFFITFAGCPVLWVSKLQANNSPLTV